MPKRLASTCPHAKLTFDPSSHAAEAGYKRPGLAQRLSGTTLRVNKESLAASIKEDTSTFPAPLVLPEDELSWNPTYPQQTLRSWAKIRNEVTPERCTVYFVGPPEVELGQEFIQEWKEPWVANAVKEKMVDFPKTENVLGYLEAFYHGLPVKMLSRKPCFTADVNDDDDPVEITPPNKRKSKSANKSNKAAEKSPTLWLNTHTACGCIGIRSRVTPNGAFTHQLNLNDLLDAAIEILPADAYALLMLVEHDIYEDEEDDFACGRAYGGSRIAVVSGARYNPILDKDQRVERDHAWPASHCEEYMQKCCERAKGGDAQPKTKKLKNSSRVSKLESEETAPMQAALAEHLALPSLEKSPSQAALSGLWLGRVSRTAGHELGHCFGIDHCVSYACSMQGTASIIEDARQPPYLCPIDLAKVLKSTGTDGNERYQKLWEFCEKYKEVHLFAAFGAWIRRRLQQSSLENADEKKREGGKENPICV